MIELLKSLFLKLLKNNNSAKNKHTFTDVEYNKFFLNLFNSIAKNNGYSIESIANKFGYGTTLNAFALLIFSRFSEDSNIAKQEINQFLREEADAASYGDENANKLARDLFSNSLDYEGALNETPKYPIDGPNGPQQLLLSLTIMSRSNDNPLFAVRFKCDVVRRIKVMQTIYNILHSNDSKSNKKEQINKVFPNYNEEMNSALKIVKYLHIIHPKDKQESSHENENIFIDKEKQLAPFNININIDGSYPAVLWFAVKNENELIYHNAAYNFTFNEDEYTGRILKCRCKQQNDCFDFFIAFDQPFAQTLFGTSLSFDEKVEIYNETSSLLFKWFLENIDTINIKTLDALFKNLNTVNLKYDYVYHMYRENGKYWTRILSKENDIYLFDVKNNKVDSGSLSYILSKLKA